MSNIFYKLISNQIVSYFQNNSLNPGDKFHVQFEHLSEVEYLYNELKKVVAEKGLYNEFVWGEDEPYQSFSIHTNEVNVIVASTLNGVTPDFLTKLRNLVGTSENNFEKTCILFIHHTTLDSIVGGSVDLQRAGMPLSRKAIESIISKAISESDLDDVAKTVLSFAFSKIEEIINHLHYSIFEYEDILSAISAGVKPESYQDLGLFYDAALGGYDQRAREERLSENYKLFKFIQETESFGDLSNDLEKEFDDEGINKILNNDWRKIEFKEIKQFHDNKKKVVPPEYIEESNKETEEGLAYWERGKGESKAKKRKRHIIVFNPSQVTDISLSFSFDRYLKKDNLENVLGNAGAISGKKIKISHRFESERVNFISVLYKESGASFEFKIAVVPFTSDFLDSIRLNYLVEIDTKRNIQCIKVLYSGEKLVLNNGAEQEKEIQVDADGEGEEVRTNLNEQVRFNILEDYFQRDNEIVLLKVDNVEFPIAFLGEKVESKKINGNKAFQLKWKQKQHFYLQETKKVILGNDEYIIDDLEFFRNLEEEKRFIEEEALCLEQENGLYSKKRLDVPAKLEKAYLNYLSYFKARNLLPSLTYWNDEITELAKVYIETFFEILNEIEEGFSLSTGHQDLSKLGVLENRDSLHAVKCSPLHPINVVHKYLLVKRVTDPEIPPEILRRLSATYLVPYIYHENKIYKAVNQGHSPEWIYYYDYKGPRNNLSSSFVSKLVTDKIKEFKQHYHYLFMLNKNAPLKINIINLGDCKEVLLGIFNYYMVELKKSGLEDLTPIEITIYDNFNTVNAFEELSFYDDIQEIESYFGLKFQNDNYAAEDILNAFRTKVEFYKKSYHDSEFDYCHISFFESDENVDETIDQTDKIGTGLSLSGLFASLTSTYLGDSYRTGFGTKYLKEEGNVCLDVIKLYNSLVLASGRQNTFERGKAIVTAFSNQGEKKLKHLYESSYWVTFIEPKFDLNYFGAKGEEDVLIIHYSDQYTPSSSYDAITVTKKSDQFKLIIEEMLKSKSVEVSSETTRDIINLFNTINGDWLLRMIGSRSQFPREKISILSAVKFSLAYLQHSNIIWVPLSLEEILRVSGAVGLNQKDGLFSAKNLGIKGSVNDDLLLMGFEILDGEIKIHLYPIEVKIGKNKTGIIEKAKEQVSQTADALETYLSENRFKSSVYKDFLVQLAITNVKKMKIYGVLEHQEWDVFLSGKVLTKLLNEEYTFSNELSSYIGNGAVISFETDNHFRKSGRESDTLLIKLTEQDGYEYLTLPMDKLFSRIHESQEDYHPETLLLKTFLEDIIEVGENITNLEKDREEETEPEAVPPIPVLAI